MIGEISAGIKLISKFRPAHWPLSGAAQSGGHTLADLGGGRRADGWHRNDHWN